MSHTPHDHSHRHVHTPALAAQAGISLLRLSAPARLGIAFALSALIWLIVYLVAR
jgi:hypothetical protein